MGKQAILLLQKTPRNCGNAGKNEPTVLFFSIFNIFTIVRIELEWITIIW